MCVKAYWAITKIKTYHLSSVINMHSLMNISTVFTVYQLIPGHGGGRVWALDLGSGICAAHQILVDRSWIFTLGIKGNSNFLSF